MRRSAAEMPPHYPRCAHRAYHLTCNEHELLLARAGGRCEMCHRGPGPRGIYFNMFDHDHDLGWRAVRGLVCPSCNAILHRVDTGKREPDDHVMAYLMNPWHQVMGLTDFACPPDCGYAVHKIAKKWPVGTG